VRGRDRSEFDYIIVGGGSAGNVLANRLSDDRSARVLLLEAGGWDWNPLFRIPIGTIKIGGEYDWQYESEPTPHGMVGRACSLPGRSFGGGSSVNATFWARGNPGDYDRWAAGGAAGWSWREVLPYFRKLEAFDGGGDQYRGGNGPQHVSRLRVRHEMTDVFIQGAVQAGHAQIEDYNGARQDGVSYSQYSQKRGLRDNTSSAYLSRARGRSNLTIRTKAAANRVVMEGNRAVAVEYIRHGKVETVRAAREVVVAAGSLASPKLL
jgi:choline dehydrogenase-like flavoprotein